MRQQQIQRQPRRVKRDEAATATARDLRREDLSDQVAVMLALIDEEIHS